MLAATSGAEQPFDLRKDPNELRNLAAKPPTVRDVGAGGLITELKNCPEGFTDGRKLIAGNLSRLLPHGRLC